MGLIGLWCSISSKKMAQKISMCTTTERLDIHLLSVSVPLYLYISTALFRSRAIYIYCNTYRSVCMWVRVCVCVWVCTRDTSIYFATTHWRPKRNLFRVLKESKKISSPFRIQHIPHSANETHTIHQFTMPWHRNVSSIFFRFGAATATAAVDVNVLSLSKFSPLQHLRWRPRLFLCHLHGCLLAHSLRSCSVHRLSVCWTK